MTNRFLFVKTLPGILSNRVGFFSSPVLLVLKCRFADHVTKRNGGSGDENEGDLTHPSTLRFLKYHLLF